jgi:uncharacterized surface protein with fasciclin (FAS1) repeats
MFLAGISTAFLAATGLPAFAHCGSCGSGDDHTHAKAEKAEAAESTPDLVGIAASNEDFSTLVAAVKAAGLVEVLQGEGPYTIFAPTNEAFAKLPDGTVESLLQPENKEQLVAILTYHVVPGKVMAADVVKLETAKTVQGGEIEIAVTEENAVMVDNATVVATDIQAKNGVIHVIDTVILPPEPKQGE